VTITKTVAEILQRSALRRHITSKRVAITEACLIGIITRADVIAALLPELRQKTHDGISEGVD